MKSVFLLTLCFIIIPFQSPVIGEYRLDIGSRWDTLKIYKNGKFVYEFRDGCFIGFDSQGSWQKQGDTLILFEKRPYIIFKDHTDEIFEEGVEDFIHHLLIIPNGLKAITTNFYLQNKIYKRQNWQLKDE